MHSDAVIEEVGTLLKANAIQEVQYPKWLANTVVVKKRMEIGVSALTTLASMTLARRIVSTYLGLTSWWTPRGKWVEELPRVL